MSPYGPFASLVGPLYQRAGNGPTVLGMRIHRKHCNRHDIVHGGMLSTLVDTALAVGARRALQARLGPADFALMTTQMSVNFIGNAVTGQWVEAHVEVERAGRRLCFSSCRVHAGNQLIVQASGQFMVKALEAPSTSETST